MSTNRACRGSRAAVEQLENRWLLAAAGALDTSFSGDGKVTMLGPNFTTVDVAIQSDGKTVIAGTERNPSTGRTQFIVARLHVDGSIDSTFGNFGFAFVQPSNLGQSSAYAVAIAPDGKIVVVGDAEMSSGFDEIEMAVVRLNPDGALDPTFDGDGRRTFDLGNVVNDTHGRDVVVQPDGRIVIVGTAYRIPDNDFAIVRLNVNGSFDQRIINSPFIGFDGDGKQFVGFGGNDLAQAVKIDLSGNLYTAGNIVYAAGNIIASGVGLMKMNSAGELVNSFGSNGVLSFSMPGRLQTSVSDLLIQPGGKVVIAGHSKALDGLNDFYVARFATDGKLDLTFGGAGRGFVVSDLGGNDVVGGITDSPVGSGFVVSGQSTGGMTLVKYTVDGVPDTGFGNSGVARLNFGGTANIAEGPGRRLTIAGGGSLATARVLEAGARVVYVAGNSNATENSTDTGEIIVGRVERLNISTRVYLGISGTASGRRINRTDVVDYTLDKVVQPVPGAGVDSRPYVDIPANETFVVVTLRTVNDSFIEGIETANFTLLPDPSYEIGTPSDAKVDIFDDEGVTTVIAVADDTYVKDGSSANTSFGSNVNLQVKTAPAGSGQNRISYLKFNLSSFSAITSARLVLFGKLSDGQNTNVPVGLFSVADSSWNGSTLNFNNKPAPGTTALASVTIIDTAVRRYEFDVSAYVKQQRALGRTVVSFQLRTPSATNSVLSFSSGNASSNRPTLNVVALPSASAFAPSNPPARALSEIGVTARLTLGLWSSAGPVDALLKDELGDVLTAMR